MRRRFSDAFKAARINAVRRGASFSSAVAGYGIDPSTLRRWCVAAGVASPNQAAPAEVWQQIEPLFGVLSDAELGRRFDIPVSTITGRRRRMGIPCAEGIKGVTQRAMNRIEFSKALKSWSRSAELAAYIEEKKRHDIFNRLPVDCRV